jgi:hypothetical protein
MTYYQLMHSVALALTFEEKPILYFSCDYLNAEESLLDRIRHTGVFCDVVGMLEATYAEPFYNDLREAFESTKGDIDSVGSSIFEKYLDPYYKVVFRDADKDDEIYIYNDFQRHYYYITKHFNKIIGVEDGYRSIAQQLQVHRFKGRYKLLEPYIDKYYPAPLYKDKKVKKIISSIPLPEIDPYYTNLIEVLDFNDLVEINNDKYKAALTYIFDLADMDIKENSTIYLGQPMSRGLYCSAGENYMLHRKTLQKALEDGRHIYIKPHPADVLDYTLFSSEQITVMPKDFPLEVLGYLGARFDKAISFGSTSNVESFVDSNVRIYNDDNLDIGQIRKFIRDYTSDEKIIVNLYLKAKSINPRSYLNLYGYVSKHRFIKLNITVLVDEKLGPEGLDYYNPKYLKKRIKEHGGLKGATKNIGLYSFEKRRLSRLLHREACDVSIEVLPSSETSDYAIYNKYIRDGRFDYFMISNLENPGFYFVRDLYTVLTKNAVKGVFYNNYTMIDGIPPKRLYLGIESGHSLLMHRISNILFHTSTRLDLNATAQQSLSPVALFKYFDDFLVRRNLSLQQDSEFYQSIEWGADYFNGILMEIALNDKHESVLPSIAPRLVGEYYSWSQVHEREFKTEDLVSLLKNIRQDNNDGQKWLLGVICAQLQEEHLEHQKIQYINEEFYNYYDQAIDRLVKNHSLLRVQQRIHLLQKIRVFLREARMLTSWKLGEDITRKLEGTGILRRLYFYVMKKEREVS